MGTSNANNVVGKIAILDQYGIWLHRVLSTAQLPSVIHTAAPDRGKLMTLIAGKRRRLLFAGHGRRSVYDKKPQRYAELPKPTEQHLIVRSGISEAETTNN